MSSDRPAREAMRPWQVVFWFVAFWIAGVASAVAVADVHVNGWNVANALFLAYFTLLPWVRAWLHIRERAMSDAK